MNKTAQTNEKQISIVNFENKYQSVFKRLNEEWITQLFVLEELDKQILANPQHHIIDKGGYILVALLDNEPVGVVALVPAKTGKYDFSIEKYAVSPKAQGFGIGTKLIKATIDKAKSLNAKRIFLETNSNLKAAVHVYKKSGFTEVACAQPEYARADVFMELSI